jgi:hypothetical protein
MNPIDFPAPAVNMVDVVSSQIKKIGYDEPSQTMFVEFANGVTYRYPEVPALVHGLLMTAESVGRHFNEHVRKQYQGVKLEPAGEAV